jgi:hypothetical protein
MSEVRGTRGRSADATGESAARTDAGTQSTGSGDGGAGEPDPCACARYWIRLIALMERAVYQQTPQALTIEEYLPQVVYEPYKARHALPAVPGPPEAEAAEEGRTEEPEA